MKASKSSSLHAPLSGADAHAPEQVNQLTGYLVSLGAFAVHPHAPSFPPPDTLQ